MSVSYFNTNEYELMNKDNIVATVSCTRDEFNDLYFEIHHIFSQLPIGFKTFKDWIENRRAPSNRQHIEKLLKRCNCYDLEGFLQVTNAATLNDTFWVRPAKSHLSWNNVSLFQNPFDDVVARIAFEGGLYGEHFSTASPEFSTDGTFAKCWTRLDNQIFLMKRGSEGGANAGLEPYSEMYASQLAAVFCPDSVPYDVVNYHEKKASKCPLFTNEQYGFAPTYKCIGVEAGIAQTLQYFSSIGSENAFRRMLVLDALIVNTDRHKGNYGILFQTDTLQPIKMAPVFDHNQSLLPYAMEDDFRDLDSYLSEKIPRIGTDFSETAAMVMTPDIRSDLRNLQDFEFSDSSNGLPKWRVTELNKLIVHQSRSILKSKKIYMSPDQPKKKNIKKSTPRL